MNSGPLPFSIRHAALAVTAFGLTACYERTPLETSVARDPRVLVTAVRCQASRTTMECAVQGSGIGASVAQARAAVVPVFAPKTSGRIPDMSVVTIGGNGTFLRLVAEGAGTSGTTVEYRVTLQNLLPQAMGLSTANTPDPNGVRVFIDNGVITTGAGTGVVTPLNATGTASFPSGPAPYWTYRAPLGAGQVSDGQLWRFNVPATVQAFEFDVYVAAELADESASAFTPSGWSFTTVSTSGVSDRICAIRVGGVLYCWGGAMAALGTGDDLSTRVPVKLDLPPAASMAIGYSQACMLTKADSTAYCWGYNQAGELGNGGANPSVGDGAPVRVRVPTGVKFQQLAAGTQTTCGLTPAGAVWCWGNNAFGEFGNGTRTGSLVPMATTMPNGVTFTSIVISGTNSSGRNVVCGLTAAGAAYCWGYNATGLVGKGTTTDSAVVVPTAVTMPPVGGGFASLALGPTSACAIGNAASTRPGRLYCWGPTGSFRGNGSDSTARAVPSPIDTLQSYQQVSPGDTFSCAIRTSKQLVCWGVNNAGRTGLNTVTGSAFTPTATNTAVSFEMVASGGAAACAATAVGAVHCWGGNTFGQVGNGDRRNVPSPTPLGGLASVVALSANALTQCALTAAGDIYCAGYAAFGQIRWASVAATALPRGVLSSRRYTAVTTGSSHTCAINTSGRAECWGENNAGQLGDSAGGVPNTGGINDALLPHEVYGTRSFFAISAGQSHTCALASADSTAYCWGAAGYVGDGTTVEKLIPTPTSGSVKFLTLATTYSGTCGLRKSDSTAFCWGPASPVGLGVGDTTARTVPTAVSGARKFRALVGGYDHWCGSSATTSALYCWGRNDGGHFREPATVRSLVPDSARFAYLKNWPLVPNSLLVAGNRFTCALNPNGGTWPVCWGSGLPVLAGRTSDIRAWADNRLQSVFTQNFNGFVVAMATSASAACTLENVSGEQVLNCRGGNASGQLGRGYFSTSEDRERRIVAP